jgi:DUF971 family protein
MANETPWPTELRLSDAGRLLTMSYDNGVTHELPAEYLRVHSPSAEVQGHAPSQRQTQFGKRNVTIAEIKPTGNYAVRLVFDDGHSSGLYTFAYLHELGEKQEEKWTAYLAELQSKGLSRDRKPPH